MQAIVNKLDTLAKGYMDRDILDTEKQAAIDSILTPEVKARIANVEAGFADKTKVLDAQIAGLETEVKQEVLKHGASVKATFLHAIWSKGRVSWDTKSLDGYATAHPELLTFRKEGEPSVSIRRI